MQVTALAQEVTDQLALVEQADAAVAAATALLNELRANQPRVSEALRASNVVDGLGLRKRWRAGVAGSRWDETTIPFGSSAPGCRRAPAREGQAIEAELRALDDAVDALADLLVAESVHQLVQGNAARAGATVDALSRGDVAPPEVEVARTPRSGTAVTHRLLVLADLGASASGWPTDATAGARPGRAGAGGLGRRRPRAREPRARARRRDASPRPTSACCGSRRSTRWR